jgi:hypothetical protein
MSVSTGQATRSRSTKNVLKVEWKGGLNKIPECTKAPVLEVFPGRQQCLGYHEDSGCEYFEWPFVRTVKVGRKQCRST